MLNQAPKSRIVSDLERYLLDHSEQISTFASKAGMNVGTISAILNLTRPVAVSHMDKITEAMGLSVGYYYESYAEDYCIETVHWRRLKGLLTRCADLHLYELIERLANNSLDNLSYLDNYFVLAESFFANQKYKAAKILYTCIMESERNAQSERLAISYYRVFQISRKLDPDNQDPVIHLLPYITKLPDNFMLKALQDVAEAFILFNRWDNVIKYARDLQSLSLSFINNGYVSRQSLDKPLIYYYGHGLLLESSGYINKDELDKGKACADLYGSLDSYVNEYDEETREVIEKFKLYANANKLAIEVKQGNQDAIPDYLDIIKENPSEILEGLVTLLESANLHGYNIDHILTEFSEYINSYKEQHGMTSSTYKEEFVLYRYATLCNEYFLLQGL